MNEKDALHNKIKVLFKESWGNLFYMKISKNIQSLILGYLNFNNIMRLNLIDKYNKNLVLY